MKRALILAVVLAGALAPAAQAQSTLVVQAAAVGHFGGFEQMAVHFECAAADVTGAPTQITRCTFGPLSAPAGKLGQLRVSSGGTVRLGVSHSLCVSATSYHATGPLTVSRCGLYDSLTGKVVIGN